MSRATLERHQVWFYLAAVILGLGVGALWPAAGDALGAMVWPLIAVLLFATFTQTPLRAVTRAFTRRRVLGAAVAGNFVVLPMVAWGLVSLADALPWAPSGGTAADAMRLGLLLVLLVPCTDWFITFAQLGRGDPALATALTPISLVLQLMLLPVYLWLFTGDAASVITIEQVGPAIVVVLGPLACAAIAERWLARAGAGERVRESLGWWPVPVLAVVILAVAAAHVGEADQLADLVPVVALIVLAFLVVALTLAAVLTRMLRLSVGAGRTLAFSFATRNSFVVLPFALALPAGWEIAALVVVIQSLVELFAMAACIWLVPRVVIPDRSGNPLE